MKPHPARFPQGLPEFFIKFLSVPGHVVLDPLAGSNVTGAAAEKLGRRWIGIELNSDYVQASKYRFEESQPTQPKPRKAATDNPPLPLLTYSEQKDLVN